VKVAKRRQFRHPLPDISQIMDRAIERLRADTERLDWISEIKENPPKIEPGKPAKDYPDFDFWDLGRFSMKEEISSSMARWPYVEEYGFVLLTQETIQALIQLLQGKHTLDVGAGTGYLASLLADAGIPITAVDSFCEDFRFKHQWIEMLECDATELLPGVYDAVILSWPTYDTDFGYRVISKMKPGQMLIYQGEGDGGCTGDNQFHAELYEPHWLAMPDETNDLNEHHRQFWGIHDRWFVYKRLDETQLPAIVKEALKRNPDA
jgi:hypothetical protein